LSQLYTINHPSITLELAIAEISTLHIHEEIMPSFMEALRKKISEDGVFVHPIIVDKETRVVLDGMHRVAASKALSFQHIPVCFVDYNNPHILLRCWYRTFRDLEAEEIEEAMRLLGLKYEYMDLDSAQRMVKDRKKEIALLTKAGAYAVDDHSDAEVIYANVKRMEKEFSRSHVMGFASEREAKEKVLRGELSACIATPALSKDEVTVVAKAGRVYPQKTTRHVIPARPMGVRVPTQWLVTSLSEGVLNERLRAHLSSMTLRPMPPGTVLDRLYEEPLYVFE